MTIGWPQGVWIALMIMMFGAACSKNGQPKAPWDPMVTLIDIAVYSGLAWWGGFFGH